MGLLRTTQQTSSSGGDQTNLLTWNSASRDGRSLTNMLMVTTTVRVVNRVHGNTTGLWPRVSLDSVLVESTASLQQRLVNSTTTSDDTDDTSSRGVDDLLGTRRKSDSGLVLVWVVADDDNVVTGGSGQSTSVTRLLLDVGDNGTFWNGTQRQDVTDVQRGLSTGVDELTSVHTLVGDEGLLTQLVLVWVTEDNLSQWGTSTSVVNDLLHDTTDVTMTLGEVQSSQLGSTLSQSGVGGEDRTSTLSLVTNNSTCE